MSQLSKIKNGIEVFKSTPSKNQNRDFKAPRFGKSSALLFLLPLLFGLTTSLPSLSQSQFGMEFQSRIEQGTQKLQISSSTAFRSIASELTCKMVFDSKAPGEAVDAYLARLKQDPAAMVDVMISSAASGKEVPVKMTRKMEDFRKLYLDYLKNPVYREPMISSFEAQLRMRSDLLRQELIQKSEASQFDAVIVGAGVHGIISAHALLAENPKLKILIVEEGDTAGATFRAAKDTFNINSSNRASGDETRPLPGEGNINELPFLPIQVSDLTAVKYPSANDLGSALVAGLYALVRQNPNVQVLFGASARTIKDAGDPKFPEQLIANSQGRELTINSQAIVISTGLGKPKFPTKLAQTLRNQPEIVQFKRGKGLPKVAAFEDIIRVIAQSNDPMSLFTDKKIAVVGTGDSANVFIEFLLGYASAKAYGQSSAQTGLPKEIGWIGQSRKSCEDFIRDARSRYAQIGTGFRSSSAKKDPILEGIPGKLEDVSLEASLGGKDTLTAIGERGDIGKFDLIVLTTGFEPNVRDLLRDVTVQTSSVFSTDSDFFTQSPTVQTIEGTTSTSRNRTKIGRKLRNREVYVVGTAAGQLASEPELVGIIQNFVSIFNNAPRVVAQSMKLAAAIEPRASGLSLAPVVLKKTAKEGKIEVRGIEETRVPPNQSLNELEAILREAVSNLRTTDRSIGKLILRIQRVGDNRLFVNGDKSLEIEPLVSLLASSREFFNLSAAILKSLSDKDLKVQIGFKDGVGSPGESSISIAGVDEITGSIVGKVTNQTVALRGLQVFEQASATPSSAVQNIQFTEMNSKIRNIQFLRSTNQIAIEKFGKVFIQGADGRTESLEINPIYNFLTVLNREGRQPLVLEESKGTLYFGSSIGSPSVNFRNSFGLDFINYALARDSGDRFLITGSTRGAEGTKVLLGAKNIDGLFEFKEINRFKGDEYVSLAWINNGKQFIVAQGKTLRIFDDKGSQILLQIDLPGRIYQVEAIGAQQVAVRLNVSSNQPDVAIVDLKAGSTKLLNIGNRIGTSVTIVGDPARGRAVFLPEDRVNQLRAVPVYDVKKAEVSEALVGETFPNYVTSGFFTKSGDLVVLDGGSDILYRAKID